MKRQRFYNLPNETKVCPICHTEFGPSASDYKSRWDKRIVCSQKCAQKAAHIANTRLGEKQCKHCHKIFSPRMEKDKFCSKQCYWQFKKGKPIEPRNGKRVILTCLQCDKEFQIGEFYARKRERKFCSRLCWREYIKDHSNPRFSHGEADPFYLSWAWKKLTTKIKERDNYTCQHCNKHYPNTSYSLVVHHIKPRGDFKNTIKKIHPIVDHPDNLLSLCRKCHSIVHFSF